MKTAVRDEQVRADPLADVRFLMWGFPETTQTFIHREMIEMRRRGMSVNVLAGEARPSTGLHPLLEEVRQRSAIYLRKPWLWVPRGVFRGMKNRGRFLAALPWALSLPHKSAIHRARFVVMLAAAADCLDEVVSSGTRYLHAHFASYHTEWAMCLSRLSGLPFGATFHAVGIWKDGNLLREKIASARVIMSCTRYNVDHLKEIAPEHAHKIHLVHHGLDLTGVPEPPEIPVTEVPRFLAIGRLIPKKGFDHLIEAIAKLRNRKHKLRLTILGDGPGRQSLEKQVAGNGLEDAVSLPGAVSNEEVWRELAATRALVAPSIRDAKGNIDGIPNVILEAMAMKRPVVGSALSGIPEVVRPDETGILVEPGDEQGLAEAMETLVLDREKAVRLGSAGRGIIEGQFDVRKNIDQQVELIAAAKGA